MGKVKYRGLRNWDKTRGHGMAHFVLFRGVLSYGLTMFVLMTFIFHRADVSRVSIVVSAALWIAGGALFGALTWFFMEWIYRKFALSITL